MSNEVLCVMLIGHIWLAASSVTKCKVSTLVGSLLIGMSATMMITEVLK